MAKLSFERLEDRAVPAVIFNGDLPISMTQVIPKTGDTVQISGSLHVVVQTTFDSAGGALMKIHFQPQGVSGVDLTTGAKYQGTGVSQDKQIFSASGVFNETTINNFNLIGQGPDNNLTFHENFHVTVDANGLVLAFIDNIHIDQGSGG